MESFYIYVAAALESTVPDDTKKQNNKLYFFLIFLIGAISAYDNYLTHKYSDNILLLERNPVGLNLMKTHGVYFFICLKAFGTIIVSICSFLLVKTKYRAAIWAVFFIQLFLFFYLTFYVAEGFFKGDFFRVWGG